MEPFLESIRARLRAMGVPGFRADVYEPPYGPGDGPFETGADFEGESNPRGLTPRTVIVNAPLPIYSTWKPALMDARTPGDFRVTGSSIQGTPVPFSRPVEEAGAVDYALILAVYGPLLYLVYKAFAGRE